MGSNNQNSLRRQKFNLFLAILMGLISKSSTCFAYPPKIRVLIQSGQETVSVSSSDHIKVFDIRNQKFIRRFTEKKPVHCSPSPLGIELCKYEIQTDLILLATLNQLPLRIEDREYRGEIIIYRDKNFKLEVINELNVELYLQGIMKQEISPKWPKAALKAQAIAARSYALYERQKNLKALYHVKATHESQVYLGLDGEDPLTNEAISETSAQILMDKNSILPAFYHACCGGHTESADNIFGNYSALIECGCEFCQSSPYYNWEVIFSNLEIRNYLLRNEIKVGHISFIQPLGYNSSGRVQKLKIDHELGTTEILAKKFRQIMGYDKLPSLLFTLAQEEETEEDNAYKKTFHFKGRGWGHGVGLCQWGSKKMAEDGAGYEEILHKYYPLATLSRIDQNEIYQNGLDEIRIDQK